MVTGVAGPALAGVRQTLGTYFGDINDHDWAGVWATFTPHMQVAVPVSQLAALSATTSDTGIVLSALSPGSGTDTATVSFTSVQSPADSPDDQNCDRWHSNYQLNLEGNVWRIQTVNPVGPGYGAC